MPLRVWLNEQARATQPTASELKPRADGDDLVRVVLDVAEQTVLQHGPFGRGQHLARAGCVGCEQAHLDLRIGAIQGGPGLSGLQAHALHAGHELADDEFEIFLVAFGGDIPGHDDFDWHNLPLLVIQHDHFGLIRQARARDLERRLRLDLAETHFFEELVERIKAEF